MSISTYLRPNIYQNAPEILGVNGSNVIVWCWIGGPNEPDAPHLHLLRFAQVPVSTPPRSFVTVTFVPKSSFYLASLITLLGPLYMEGPNGCRPKSSRFLPIGLLGIVKIGPRALHWGPIQISSHPTWQSTWRKFGAKTLGLSKENGPRFSLAPINKTWTHMRLGPKMGQRALHWEAQLSAHL
jgi:hypothetical protein